MLPPGHAVRCCVLHDTALMLLLLQHQLIAALFKYQSAPRSIFESSLSSLYLCRARITGVHVV